MNTRFSLPGHQVLVKSEINYEVVLVDVRKQKITSQEKTIALNENVIGRLKRFKIISDKYRNRPRLWAKSQLD